jgi:hypothetical protein
MEDQFFLILCSFVVYSILLFLGRNFLIPLLSSSVQHGYNKKIKDIESSLRKAEAKFSNDLAVKSSEIDALKGGALSNAVNSQNILYERKVKAVESLWQSTVEIRTLTFTAKTVGMIDVDVVLKEISNNSDKGKQYKKLIESLAPTKDFSKSTAPLNRLFVSSLSWALYSAYEAILMRAYAQAELLKVGVGAEALDNDNVIKLIEAVLPHHKEFIQNHGLESSYLLQDELEGLLFQELQNSLNGSGDDEQAVNRALCINQIVEKVIKEDVKV